MRCRTTPRPLFETGSQNQLILQGSLDSRPASDRRGNSSSCNSIHIHKSLSLKILIIETPSIQMLHLWVSAWRKSNLRPGYCLSLRTPTILSIFNSEGTQVSAHSSLSFLQSLTLIIKQTPGLSFRRSSEFIVSLSNILESKNSPRFPINLLGQFASEKTIL